MSDILRQLHEDHKKRMRRLQPPPQPQPVPQPVISPPPPTPTPKPKPPRQTWERCVALIASTYNRKVGRSKIITTPITKADILGDSQLMSIVLARNVAIYLTRMSSKLSTPQIGRAFNKHHTSVLHSLAKVQALVDKSPEVKEEVERLLAQVRPICAEEASAAADVHQ